MVRLTGYEWKKILMRPVTAGALAVLGVFCMILLHVYCFEGSDTVCLTPEGTRLSGQEAVRFDQATAVKYEGDFTDEQIARMIADFATEYPEEYEALKSDRPVSDALPSSYLYLSMFLPTEEYIAAVSDAGIRDTDSADMEKTAGLLTEKGYISLTAYDAAFVEKPLQYGYGSSWSSFLRGFCSGGISAAVPVLLVTVIGVSALFSGEYSSGMDRLIRTARYGKSRQIWAKLLTAFLFAEAIAAGVFLIFAVCYGFFYHLDGWNADMQTNLPLLLLSVGISMSNLQMVLFAFGLLLSAAAVTAFVTAAVSSFTASPFSSLILSLALLIAPGILRQMTADSLFHDLLLLFPVNAVNAPEVLRSSLDAGSVFSGHPCGAVTGILTGAVLVSACCAVMAYFRFSRYSFGEQ